MTILASFELEDESTVAFPTSINFNEEGFVHTIVIQEILFVQMFLQ